MKKELLDRAWKLHCRFLNKTNAICPGTRDDIRFLTLALAGEVGELANFIKKDWRGDKVEWKDIHNEVVDVAIYLDLLIEALGLTYEFDQLLIDKIDIVEQRLIDREL